MLTPRLTAVKPPAGQSRGAGGSRAQRKKPRHPPELEGCRGFYAGPVVDGCQVRSAVRKCSIGRSMTLPQASRVR